MARENNITERREDPGELHEEAYQFPDGGIIPSIMEYTMSQAPRPNRPLALAGALTMTSHMMGRRYIAEDGTSPNIYLIALANSGCGKDYPRKVNRNIAVELGMVGTVCDSFASGGGLEDSVLLNTRILAQYDEMDTLFRAMKADKSGSSEPMSAMMLSLYGDSCSSHSRRQLSAVSNSKSQIPAYCIRPSLSIFGTAIPKQFFASMSDRMLTNGLFARCLLIPTGDRPALNEAPYRESIIALIGSDDPLLSAFIARKRVSISSYCARTRVFMRTESSRPPPDANESQTVPTMPSSTAMFGLTFRG